MDGARPPKRIVLSTYGSPGDLFPFLAIGTELRERGYEVAVAASERYRGSALTAGLGFAAVRPERAEGLQEPDFLGRLWRDRQWPGQLFREMFLPGLRESLADLLDVVAGADVVVSHTLTPAAPLAAEALGVPWVSAVMQPMGFLSAYEPPVVGAAWVGSPLRAAGPSLAKPVLGMARGLTATWTVEWHELRAELGLPPANVHPLWEGQHAPGRSLGLFPRLLGEPQPDWPPQARVTGFPFYRAPGAALDPAVEDFLNAGEPPVVFTLGTTAVNDPGAFFAESAAAARRLGRRALLLVGGREGGRSGHVGGVLTAPYAPHHLVFPHAAAVVHQGGIGTLSECLLAGKPMLIVPYAHDQFDNAWRAERLGVGRVLARRRYREAGVSRVLARLLADRTAGQAARLAGQSMLRERGAGTAADAIEEALRREGVAASDRGVRTLDANGVW